MLLVLAVLALHVSVVPTYAANILLMPWMNTSHFLEVEGVGRPLADRGHNVYILHERGVKLPRTAGYKLVTYGERETASIVLDTRFQHDLIESSKKGLNVTRMTEVAELQCRNLLSDVELFPKLESLKLDLVILDFGPMACMFLVPYKLKIPYVTTSSLLVPWLARVPLVPTAAQPTVGLEILGLTFCEETEGQLSIVRRFCRALGFMLPEVLFNFVDYDYYREYVDFPSMTGLFNNISLLLINSGHLLSSPLPKMPKVEYVGGLTTRPAKPLESDLEKWMAESPDVVVVSFGSMLANLPIPIAQKLFEAFSRLPKYRFLFRFRNDASKSLTVPSNVRLMDWLPQNDALGHNSTRLFITHSGNNGQQEALYHGVPMLCFYVQYDQRKNAMRVAQRGFGNLLNLIEFTADQLVENIKELMENSSYRNRIRKASEIFHSERHPSERAADAVEHVLKFGSAHLQPDEAYELSFWEYYMIDVLAVIYSFVLITFIIIIKLILCLLRPCFAESKKRM